MNLKKIKDSARESSARCREAVLQDCDTYADNMYSSVKDKKIFKRGCVCYLDNGLSHLLLLINGTLLLHALVGTLLVAMATNDRQVKVLDDRLTVIVDKEPPLSLVVTSVFALGRIGCTYFPAGECSFWCFA